MGPPWWGITPSETTTDVERVAFQKDSVKIKDDHDAMKQLYTFDMINRDPRGHVSVTYMGCDSLLHNED